MKKKILISHQICFFMELHKCTLTKRREQGNHGNMPLFFHIFAENQLHNVINMLWGKKLRKLRADISFFQKRKLKKIDHALHE